jgi:ABC-type phosphate/phosphonate transport system substrate-binding protein
MHPILSKGALVSAVAISLLAGGCATKESVEHAQSTADQALSAAQAAQHAADQNRTDINSLQQELEQMKSAPPPRHHGERG